MQPQVLAFAKSHNFVLIHALPCCSIPLSRLSLSVCAILPLCHCALFCDLQQVHSKYLHSEASKFPPAASSVDVQQPATMDLSGHPAIGNSGHGWQPHPEPKCQEGPSTYSTVAATCANCAPLNPQIKQNFRVTRQATKATLHKLTVPTCSIQIHTDPYSSIQFPTVGQWTRMDHSQAATLHKAPHSRTALNTERKKVCLPTDCY